MFNKEELENLKKALTDAIYGGGRNMPIMLAYAKLYVKVREILEEGGDEDER